MSLWIAAQSFDALPVFKDIFEQGTGRLIAEELASAVADALVREHNETHLPAKAGGFRIDYYYVNGLPVGSVTVAE